MRIRMGLVGPSSAPEVRDILLDTGTVPGEAEDAVTFGRVRPQLAALLPDPCHRFSVDGHEVSDDDVVGEGRLLRGALLRAVPPDHSAQAPRRMPLGSGALVELHIVGGPGAGRIVHLRRGEHVLGRAASSDIRLDDLGISRAHAVIIADDAGVRLRDLDPTNPSLVDGRPVPTAGTQLTPGSRIHLASTTLVPRRPETTPAAAECSSGTIRINRRPRFLPGTKSETIHFPAAPTRPKGARAPVVAALAPLVISVGLAAVLRSPVMLLFALMSPVLLLAQWWGDRRHGRVSYRTQLAEHSARNGAGGSATGRGAGRRERRRHAEQPDLATAGIDRRPARRPGVGAAPRRPGPLGAPGRHGRPACRDEGGQAGRGGRVANRPGGPCRHRPEDARCHRHRRAPTSIPLRRSQSHRPDGNLALAARHPCGRDLGLCHDAEADWAWASRLPHALWRRPGATGNRGLDPGRGRCGCPPQERCGHQRPHRPISRWWPSRPSPPWFRGGARRHGGAPTPSRRRVAPRGAARHRGARHRDRRRRRAPSRGVRGQLVLDNGRAPRATLHLADRTIDRDHPGPAPQSMVRVPVPLFGAPGRRNTSGRRRLSAQLNRIARGQPAHRRGPHRGAGPRRILVDVHRAPHRRARSLR